MERRKPNSGCRCSPDQQKATWKASLLRDACRPRVVVDSGMRTSLYNPLEPATKSELKETEVGARSLGVTLQPIAVRSVGDLSRLSRRPGETGHRGCLCSPTASRC